MRIRNTNPTALATGAMYCAPFGGADPFSPNSGTDPNNIFNQAQQRQQQQSNTMPNGMQQQPPQGSTNPNYNRQDQQFQQTGATGNVGDDPNDALINQGGGSGNGQGGSPLDKYRSNGDNGNQSQGGQDPNAQQQQQAQQQQPQEVDYFEVGADKYHQLFQQQDFTKGVDQELVGKALEGDAESFMQVLNSVARNAASGSSYLSSKVASKGVSSRLDKFGQDVPKMVRDQAVNEMFANNKNKFYTDPAMQPMVEAVRGMVTKRNPNATAQQVTEEVELILKEAMGGFGGAFAGDDKKKEDADDGQDMSALFG